MGRLTRDPELRRTGSGTAVTSFALAVDRDFKSQSGEKETDFIDIVAWRATAEFVSKYFSKGRMVAERIVFRYATMAEGTIKKAIFRRPEFRRFTSAAEAASSCTTPRVLDIAGSSAAETAMPNKLTGNILIDAAVVMAAMAP